MADSEQVLTQEQIDAMMAGGTVEQSIPAEAHGGESGYRHAHDNRCGKGAGFRGAATCSGARSSYPSPRGCSANGFACRAAGGGSGFRGVAGYD